MSKSSLAVIATELEKMPKRMGYARRAMETWRDQGLRTVRKNPGRSILGALAIGFIVAKIARRY